MSMLTYDLKQPVPKFPHDFKDMCQEIGVTPIPSGHLLTLPFWKHIDSTYAKAHLVGFELSQHPILDWYASRNKLGGYQNDGMPFFEQLLSKKSISQQMSAFGLQKNDSPKLDLELSSGFLLDGQLTSALVIGGCGSPYLNNGGTEQEAKSMALEFCTAMFDYRYKEVDIFICRHDWSPWFYGIVWDCSFFIIDRRYRRIWILCWTDTD